MFQLDNEGDFSSGIPEGEFPPFKTLESYYIKANRQKSEIGTPGTKEEPVIIKEDWNNLSKLVMHWLQHAHDAAGNCRKNRFGRICVSGVHPAVTLYGALDTWQECAVYWHEQANDTAKELNRVKDELRRLKEDQTFRKRWTW